jgi:hypothetical protein
MLSSVDQDTFFVSKEDKISAACWASIANTVVDV